MLLRISVFSLGEKPKLIEESEVWRDKKIRKKEMPLKLISLKKIKEKGASEKRSWLE